jgi:predicted MFS family arabinose efflux permease
MIVLLSLVVGITDALSMPSFQTIVRSIVDRENVGTALALNATQFNLSRILGPALAGAMMASFGAVACFSANAASFIPFILVALWVLPKGPTRANADEHESWDIRASLQAFAQHPALVQALATVFLTSMLCGPMIVFAPLLIRDILHGDVATFGGVVGAFGIGGVLGSILLVAIGSRFERRWVSASFAVCYGIILMLVALLPWISALTLLFVLAGLAMNVSNTSVNTTLQTVAPASALGRTVSLYMLALRGGLSIGSFATGLSVGLLGVREALFVNGLLAVVSQLSLAVALARQTQPP